MNNLRISRIATIASGVVALMSIFMTWNDIFGWNLLEWSELAAEAEMPSSLGGAWLAVGCVVGAGVVATIKETRAAAFTTVTLSGIGLLAMTSFYSSWPDELANEVLGTGAIVVMLSLFTALVASFTWAVRLINAGKAVGSESK